MKIKTTIKTVIVSFVFLLLTFIAVKTLAAGAPTYCYVLCGNDSELICQIPGCWYPTPTSINCGGSVISCGH